MEQHTDLAKNILPNCAQGRSTSENLWKTLTLKLNSNGPPTKDVKNWRKVCVPVNYK